MDRVGAQGHMTFGGRLAPEARGFPASAMAKKHAGDWRRPESIKAWASELSRALPTARPGVALAPGGRSPTRLVLHGLAGWAACALAMGGLLAVGTPRTALILHALAAPAIVAIVARHYFRAHGARDPLPTALTFLTIVIMLDLVIIAGLLQHSLGMFESIMGSWLPFALVFCTTWLTGEVMAMMPGHQSPRRSGRPPSASAVS